MGTSWKTRGTYGLILYRKIKKLNKKFNAEIDSAKPNYELLFNYSKAMDYSIQVQLTNINKVEEFEMLQKMEGVESDHQYTEPIPQVGSETSQVKF